ncbi:MmgE/PrpD family protein [Rhodobacteraceae bacterium NNCM2]|nr:MmgE/PrpD family protein [Coraliihabitans acroporae]
MEARAPITGRLAAFIAEYSADTLPGPVFDYMRLLAFDGIGVLYAATHPSVTANQVLGGLAGAHGGQGAATLIGRGRKVDPVTTALVNGTLGYAADFEPHHPEAILHPVAVMGPTTLALSEVEGRSGRDFIAAMALGCEITYRVSMAMNPRALYARGFHPSAIAGSFGAAAASAFLLRLDPEQVVRTLGLAALQTSGLMAWQDDPKEDARPFQMGLAARNGVMSALLARDGFGAPDRIFDGGHNVLTAYSDVSDPAPLTDGLGEVWDGVTELAIKPYSCVSFLHPALDAMNSLMTEGNIRSEEIAGIQLRFADAGAHCVDDNPLKGHSAQYILPVRAARGRLSYIDLFEDRRETDTEVARLAAATTVLRDKGEFDEKFPDLYIGEVTLTLSDGRSMVERSDVARGYPERPLPQGEIARKFDEVVGNVASAERCSALAAAAEGIAEAPSVAQLAALLAEPPVTAG